MDDSMLMPVRIMPNSPQAEQSVIGAMLIDGGTIPVCEAILIKDDFYNQIYGAYFEAIVELFNAGKPVDPIVLSDKLQEKKIAPENTTVQFINALIDSVPLSINTEEYATIVKEKALLRQIIHVNQDIENECFEGKQSTENILEKTEHDIFGLVQKKGAKDFVPIKDVVGNALDAIRKASMNSGPITGVPTGFIDLDTKTAGLQPSDLILLAARPSMGKTALALNIAENVAFKENRSMVIFSLEMSKEQLINRMFSLESGIEAEKLRTGTLKDDEWIQLMEAASVIGKSKLLIDDTPSISIGELRSKCRKFKLEHEDMSMIMIDYLQLMSGSGRSESRQLEIAEISRSLKALARELKVPVVALSQLSREVEKRENKRPMMSDLRDSGAIEQDADVVMFIYRDDYYNKDSEKKGIAEVIIAKQRNGPIGTVDLAWLPERTKFGNRQHEKRFD
ncbi:MAG: replicative DNA helicase [Lachnospiraceae bacterium]|nr:replicative DNA helicase [Lachnospiraceae bacterium]